jgi:hypothetical protein
MEQSTSETDLKTEKQSGILDHGNKVAFDQMLSNTVIQDTAAV